MSAIQNPVVLHHELLARMAEARARTDELFDLVRPDALYDRPIPERHRIIFYIGHLEAFDWNLLRDRLVRTSPFDPDFDRLFAFGIDPVGGGLPTDQPADWPSLGRVREYVAQVRDTLDESMQGVTLDDSKRPGEDFSAIQLLHVAIEHRLMHAETLAYMLHQLPSERKIRPSLTPPIVATPHVPRMIDIPAGTATLGLSRTEKAFGWDNEFELCSISVPAFGVDQFKVTNGEYLEFLSAGGYSNRAYWNDADWQWKAAHNISCPVFWKRSGEGWSLRTMFDEIPLPVEWPVYVSQAEANAFARWKDKALPTEAQWHRVAFGMPGGGEQDYPWGTEPPAAEHGNFDFHRWDPTPVSAHPAGQSAFGVADMLGNGWEWTSTIFAPFPGFQPFSFYRGYSADFFDGKHYVMKGGSPRTAACMIRRSFRNWFQSQYQYVYAGFRCVRS